MYDAKLREQYREMHTVADLREMLQKYGIKAPSKARKDDLITLLLRAGAVASNSVQMSSGDVREAKYNGKRVLVQIGTRHDKLTGEELPNDISGIVKESVHRDSSMGKLLLAIQHDATRFGNPRVTLHRAEDVVLV